MTEDQAKEKYCPLAPMALGSYGPTMMSMSSPFNPGTGYAAPMRQYTCQASACMMWRWDRTTDHMHGHCGLAGPTS